LWNSITNTNTNCNRNSDSDGYRDSHTDCNRDADCHCDGNTDRNSNSHSHTKTHSNAEAPHHTKATSDPTASSVTGAKPRKRHGFRHPKDGLYAAKQLPDFQSRKAED
jgi:hypothetical protein